MKKAQKKELAKIDFQISVEDEIKSVYIKRLKRIEGLIDNCNEKIAELNYRKDIIFKKGHKCRFKEVVGHVVNSPDELVYMCDICGMLSTKKSRLSAG